MPPRGFSFSRGHRRRVLPSEIVHETRHRDCSPRIVRQLILAVRMLPPVVMVAMLAFRRRVVIVDLALLPLVIARAIVRGPSPIFFCGGSSKIQGAPASAGFQRAPTAPWVFRALSARQLPVLVIRAPPIRPTIVSPPIDVVIVPPSTSVPIARTRSGSRLRAVPPLRPLSIVTR
ncbi:hypothetical protein DFJ74DRAFT_649566 [Hyaloraphidium curvatum]|nr:hypothetical protein DFJ74DRAFT_649566 [Hyaloraphidium curvatum]